MRRFVVIVGLLLAFSVSGSSSVRADEPTEADTQAAKIHFQAGEQYYLRGHYGEAIGEFKEAYRLSQAAALLYNMSQAYERMGDLPHAREYMQKYLDSGQADPGELVALREKLRNLDKRLADQKTAEAAKPQTIPPTTPPVVAEPAPVPPAPAPVPADTPRPWKTWKWVAAGTGGGFLVLALLFAADASKMQKDLEAAVTKPPTAMYTPDLADKYTRGDRDGKLAAGFAIGGVALAATGVVLFILDGKSGSEKAPRAALVPAIGPRTAGASAILRF